MELRLIRLNGYVLRFVGAIACACVALLSAAAPARGQCSPQQFPKLLAGDVGLGGNPYRFGTSAAVSGDIAVIGAPGGFFNSGAAYVFVPGGPGFVQQVRLTASDAELGDDFGRSVGVSGETAVVGAPGDFYGASSNAGSAYVYVRSGITWTQQAHLFPPAPVENNAFGGSVAISGNTAVIGAVGDMNEGDLGKAYVFIRTGSTWTQQAVLTASNPLLNSAYGAVVAVSGDIAVVGAPTGGEDGEGAAYVYVRSGTTWSEQAILNNFTGLTEFGESVAISGETAVVGQPNSGGLGIVHVFKRVGTTWPQQTQFSASDETVQNLFGNSVAISGDTIVVGAVDADQTGLGTDIGAAYVFTRSGTVWTQRSKLIAVDATTSDAFGSSVAVSGDNAVVGADLEDNLGGVDAGAAYAFDLNCGAAPICCAGDFNASNNVTTADISSFVSALLAGGTCAVPPVCCTADLNADGVVNGGDVSGFTAKLLGGGACP